MNVCFFSPILKCFDLCVSDVLRLVLLARRAGHVHSVKLLTERHCAFVNYTNQEDCEEAIRRLNVSDCWLQGTGLALCCYASSSPFFLTINSNITIESALENHISRHAALSDLMCYYFSLQNIHFLLPKSQKTQKKSSI